MHGARFQVIQRKVGLSNLSRGGEISPGTSATTSKRTEKVAEHLLLNAAGVLYTSSAFNVLIYPTKQEEWRFIEQMFMEPVGSATAKISYIIIQTENSPDISCGKERSLLPNVKAGDLGLHRAELFQRLNSISFRALLPKCKQGQSPYNFYLMLPSMGPASTDFIASWLLPRHPKCKIYSSQTAGSWDYFVNNVQIGVVLVHESAVRALSKIPIRRLTSDTKTMNFWFISESTTRFPMFPSSLLTLDESRMGRITATRLFPHGHAILLTPSFLIAEPDEALKFLEWFHAKKATPGTYKIVCCRNLAGYLLALADDKNLESVQFYAERERLGKHKADAEADEAGLTYQTCKRRYECHLKVLEMTKSAGDELSGYDSSGLDDIEHPLVYAPPHIDPDDEVNLVTWFAGWAMCNLDRFRKYTVIGTGSKDTGRIKRLKTVGIQADRPRQYDGSSDPFSRRVSSAKSSRRTSNPGIQTNDDGRNFVPRSVRSSGTERREIAVKPGYNPPKDREVFSERPRRNIDGVPQYEVHSGISSRRASVKSTSNDWPLNSPAERMDVDEPFPAAPTEPEARPENEKDEETAMQVGSNSPGEKDEQEQKEMIQFETTREWYGWFEAEGKGWQHVWVDSWYKVLPSIMKR